MNEIEPPTMSGEQLQFPEWQTHLLEAIMEFNPDKLTRKIQQAEVVIFKRLEQLKLESNSQGEQAAMRDALYVIRKIRKDRLGDSPDS